MGDNMEKKFVIHRSKKKLLAGLILILCIALLFSFTGIFLLSTEGITIISMMNIFLAFFCTCFFICMKIKYKKGKPEVIIDQKGVYLENFEVLLLWSDLLGVCPKRYLKQPFLFFIIENEEIYLEKLKESKRKMALINKSYNLPAFNILFSSLENRKDLLKALNHYKVPMIESVS